MGPSTPSPMGTGATGVFSTPAPAPSTPQSEEPKGPGEYTRMFATPAAPPPAPAAAAKKPPAAPEPANKAKNSYLMLFIILGGLLVLAIIVVLIFVLRAVSIALPGEAG